MSSYEAAWFLGLTSGHAMLGYIVAVLIGARRRRLARVGAAFGASAAANGLLTVGLTLVTVVQAGSGNIPKPLLAIFLLAYFTVVFNVGGALGTLLGSLAGCRLAGPAGRRGDRRMAPTVSR